MKKFLLLSLFVPLLIITACDRDPVPEDDLLCEDGQIPVDGECIALNHIEQRLHGALENTAALDHYAITVVASDHEVIYDFTMRFDEGKSMFQDANTTTFYTRDDDVCTLIDITLDTKTHELIDCPDQEAGYQFYRAFDYSWFTVEQDRYVLDDEHLAHVGSLFETVESGISLDRLSLDVALDHIHTIDMIFVDGDTTIDITMTFTEVGSATITLPEE